MLKRDKVPACDIVSFYCTCIRPVLEYCASQFFFIMLYPCTLVKTLNVGSKARVFHDIARRFLH